MAWVKIDDGFYMHPKRWLLGENLEALGLWLVCLCYASHQLTDGFIPKEFMTANRPRPDRRGALKKLLEVGLLEELDNGYLIHHYLDYNPTRAEVLARREVRAEAGRKGGQRSGKTRRGGQNLDADERKKRQAAAKRANTALKAGRIQHGPCVVCGVPGEEMHHEDYDRPEEIVWLCRAHHRDLHRERWSGSSAQANASALLETQTNPDPTATRPRETDRSVVSPIRSDYETFGEFQNETDERGAA